MEVGLEIEFREFHPGILGYTTILKESEMLDTGRVAILGHLSAARGTTIPRFRQVWNILNEGIPGIGRWEGELEDSGGDAGCFRGCSRDAGEMGGTEDAGWK